MSEYNRTQPMVSVVCPCYNHAPYLRQALDSILMQKTDFEFEVLIGDDCSPDNSREILREYEEKYPGFFTMLYREQNMGGTKNGYDMYMRAKGKYIVTLETDDYWTDPNKLQKQVDFLEAHPEYMGCAHDYKRIDKYGNTITENCIDRSFCHSTFTLQDFLERGFVFQTNTRMYRNFWQDGQDYSIFHKSHPLVGDLTSNSIILSRGPIYVMPECMSVYRRVIEEGGTSAASISTADCAKSIYEGEKQLNMLETYFGGAIIYEKMRTYHLCTYFSSLLRGKEGFQWTQFRDMWRHADSRSKGNTVKFVLGYPIRKIKKLFKEPNADAQR